MERILILGGGMAGYYIAKGLEKSLKPGQAQVTLVDIRTHMIYQPFLAEVASGCIESRHVQVALRSHLRKTNIVQAKVKIIDRHNKTVTVSNEGETWQIPYDQVIICLGAVTKTFPTPGVADQAIGLKTTEEAVWIRNKIIENFSIAQSLPADSPRRKRLLTYVVVGGGFSGIEGFSEMLDLTRMLLKTHPGISKDEVELHLIEATDHIMPEMPLKDSKWVIEQLEKRGAHIHLSTFCNDATDGIVKLSTGEEIPTDVLVWTAGVVACPVMAESDLPLEPRGRLTVDTKLRVVDGDEVLPGMWGCGDATCCEDLSGGGLPDKSCAPTAQHAVRQARVLVKNVIGSLSGQAPQDYCHKNAGCVAGLGAWLGIFASGQKKLIVRGPFAWCMHRGYHGFAMPTWERKLRIFGDWTGGLILGKDVSSTPETMRPKAFFEKFAKRPAEK